MIDYGLSDKTAVVTGGARGIGHAIATRLLEHGARCVLWDIDGKALDKVSEQLRSVGSVGSVIVDITDPEQATDALRKTEGAMGPVDILVNNAGVAGASKTLWECDPDEWRQVIDLDLFAVFLCCRAVVPQMLSRGFGRIVNIASIAGKEGNPNASHYSAAKAGVIGLTKSLGKELAQSGVLVNAVAPSVIQTEILKQCSKEHVDYMVSKIPMGRMGQAEEVAALVSWLCSRQCTFSTGAVYDVSGGRATY
ncbi:MAG: 2-dehydro-3-deoxy-L-rhamnonate dehydrogenase (NAD(+)) [Verrucomicrobia subdivision 3 bacterium]|nr:2-dehydro-3-deoxy-L-rhamnonate dehydrogenase (NAD(+)) [Limisphaerales bacterium]MCS1414458.1 2-dehydro-3-deoxy-L-rhamnonate dehydrogenase (NAD(+)) [Limisphaerales bacterium]